jgi:hypothetical protein
VKFTEVDGYAVVMYRMSLCLGNTLKHLEINCHGLCNLISSKLEKTKQNCVCEEEMLAAGKSE